jgi:hypothetical protein
MEIGLGGSTRLRGARFMLSGEVMRAISPWPDRRPSHRIALVGASPVTPVNGAFEGGSRRIIVC